MDQNENSIIQFFDLFIKKWTLSSKITNVGDSNSNTPYILAYCLFADWIFAITFFAKVIQNIQLNCFGKKWCRNSNRLKSYKASNRRTFSNPHPVLFLLCSSTVVCLWNLILEKSTPSAVLENVNMIQEPVKLSWSRFMGTSSFEIYNFINFVPFDDFCNDVVSTSNEKTFFLVIHILNMGIM